MSILNSVTWHKQVMGKSVLVSDDFDNNGYGEIVSTEKRIIGADLCGLAAETYDIDVNVDSAGNQALSIVVLGTETWDDIAALIEAAVQAAFATEDCHVIAGGIRVTSTTSGASSAVVIVAGTAASGGGDLLAAITALSDYTSAVKAFVGDSGQVRFKLAPNPEDHGVANRLNEVIFTHQIFDEVNEEKSGGFKAYFDDTTGYAYIENAGSAAFAEGDVAVIGGTFLNAVQS